MLVTLSEIVMDVKALQSRKAELPILSPLVNTTVCKLFCGIKPIALVGIVAATIFVHLEKARSPMLVTPFPMVTDVNPVQSRKASSPMLVTLSGMVTDVKLLQP